MLVKFYRTESASVLIEQAGDFGGLFSDKVG